MPTRANVRLALQDQNVRPVCVVLQSLAELTTQCCASSCRIVKPIKAECGGRELLYVVNIWLQTLTNVPAIRVRTVERARIKLIPTHATVLQATLGRSVRQVCLRCQGCVNRVLFKLR